MEDNEKKEQLVDHYIKEKQVEDAVKLLFDLIVSHAKAQNVIKAEALRDKLFEVDPMALTEITKSGDIIEEEKTKMMDPDHLDTWAQLYDTLTTEENHALFFTMKTAEYNEGDTVYEQGAKNANLYFIDKGQLKMVYRKDEEEFLIKEIGPADYSGDDVFFSTTIANSVSLIAESDVKLRILHNKELKGWSASHPGLYSRILDHCLKGGMVNDVFKEKKIERRTQKRVEISGNGQFQFLKKSGETLGDPFKGTLSDISIEGVCFFMRISKRETARLLLGRRVNMKIQIQTDQDKLKLDEVGTIVGVCEDAFQDYSIHVEFEKEQGDDLIEYIEKRVKEE